MMLQHWRGLEEAEAGRLREHKEDRRRSTMHQRLRSRHVPFHVSFEEVEAAEAIVKKAGRMWRQWGCCGGNSTSSRTWYRPFAASHH